MRTQRSQFFEHLLTRQTARDDHLFPKIILIDSNCHAAMEQEHGTKTPGLQEVKGANQILQTQQNGPLKISWL